jgi:hypothetical protein
MINHPTRGASIGFGGCAIFLHHLQNFLPERTRAHVRTVRNISGALAVGVIHLEGRLARFSNESEKKFVPATYANI